MGGLLGHRTCLTYEASTHAPNGEYGDCYGVHECGRLVGHIDPVRPLPVGLPDKLLYHLKYGGGRPEGEES